MSEAPSKTPWYADGLRFTCTACGDCCRNHGDGFEYVYATRRERQAIAKHLGSNLVWEFAGVQLEALGRPGNTRVSAE